MKVQINPTSVIKTRLGIEKYGKAHKAFAEICKREMNRKYVPEDSGELISNSRVDNQCNIIYNTPYAHYQYIGKVYVDPKTGKGAFFNENYGFWSRPGIKKIPTEKDLQYHKPGSGPYWDKRMVSVEMANIQKELQEFVKKGCKK